MLLRDTFEVVLERAVVELHCAHRLGDERVVVLIWTGFNHGYAERWVVFFETRCQDAARESTPENKIVGHNVCYC